MQLCLPKEMLIVQIICIIILLLEAFILKVTKHIIDMELINLTTIVYSKDPVQYRESNRAYCLSAKSYDTSYAHHNAASFYRDNESQFFKTVRQLYDIRYGIH